MDDAAKRIRTTEVKTITGSAGVGISVGGSVIFPLEPDHLAEKLTYIIAGLERDAFDAGMKHAQRQVRRALGLATNSVQAVDRRVKRR
jgi:hypothetical protein